MAAVRLLVQREQRHDPGERAAVGKHVVQGAGDRGTVVPVSADQEPLDVGSAGRQLALDRGHRFVPGQVRGDGEEPGSGRTGRGGDRQRLPGDAVAPGVDRRLVPVPPPPRRQDGEQVCERGAHVVLDAECLGQDLWVAAVDGLPEAGLSGVLGRERVGAARQVGHRLRPVLLVLEDIRRQVDPAGCGALEVGGPVDVRAAHVHFRDRLEQCLRLVPVEAQGGDAGVALAVQALLCHAGQHAAGAEFEERRGALLLKAPHTVVEADRPAEVTYPVLRVGELTGIREPAGDGGDDGDNRRVKGQPCGDRTVLVEQFVRVRGVESVADAQPLRLTALRLEVCGDRQRGVLVARDHRRELSVERGDRHSVGQQRKDFFLGGLDGHHGTVVPHGLRQAAPGGDQCRRVLQREHARHVGCGQFAEGVPHQEVGGDAPRRDQPEERDLDGEDSGLCVAGLVQQVTLVEHDIAERPVEMGVQFSAYGVEGVLELRICLVELAAHALPLRPLAREQHSQPAVSRRALHHT